jgi:hypothetical protein
MVASNTLVLLAGFLFSNLVTLAAYPCFESNYTRKMGAVKLLTVLTMAALLVAGCGQGQASSPVERQERESGVEPTLVSKKEIRALGDKESMVLLQCQGQKVYEDLGPEEGEKYLNRKADELIASIEEEMTNPDADNDPLLQWELAKDGYYCDAKERKEFAKAQRRAEQEALWGPPRQLEEENPGIFGGAFVDEVEYRIDNEHTGNWMGISKNNELKVSTTADSDAELHKLAETLKEKEAEGFDFVRIEYFAGKEDLQAKTYEANGTICILNSEDGLLLFKDQYPMGPAAKQAEEDFKKDDGIVFLGSRE